MRHIWIIPFVSSLLSGQIIPAAPSGGSVGGASSLSTVGASAYVKSTGVLGGAGKLNLSAFGAVGDFVADDTAAVQAWVNAGTTSSFTPPLGKDIFCPGGTYKLTSTVTILNIFGLRMIGAGDCVFKWAGNATTPMFDLQNVANSEFVGFRITTRVETFPLAEAFRLQYTLGATVTPSANIFRNLEIEGTNAGINYGFRGKVGSFGDQNVDLMVFDAVRVANVAIAGWSIEGINMLSWTFYGCNAVGGKYAVSGGDGVAAKGNIAWDAGFVGNHTVANFFIGTPPGPGEATSIKHVRSEGSARLYETDSSGSAGPTLIESVSFASNGLNADGYALKFRNPGPHRIVNSTFGEDYAKAVKVYWDYIGSFFRPQLVLQQAMIKGTLNTSAAIFPITLPTSALGLTAQTADSVFVPLMAGVAPIYGSVHSAAQTAAITTQTLCTTTNCTGGLYKVSAALLSTVTCATPGPAAAAVNLTWTDEAGAKTTQAIPLDVNNALTFSASLALGTTTGYAFGNVLIRSTGAQPIQYATTYTACTSGTGTYNLDLTVEQKQ